MCIFHLLSERADRIVKAAVLLAAVAALGLLAVARADTVEGDNVRVSFDGRISPNALPRSKPAPVSLHVSGTVRPIEGGRPATLERLTIQVNRHAVFTVRGLPSCPLRRLRGTDSRQALANCGQALLGGGFFNSHIDIPEQARFPAFGRVLAFNTSRGDRSAVALHVYGRTPASITTILSAPLTRSGPATGPFGPKLTIEMPRIGDDWGYVTGFSLTLHRRYLFDDQMKSVVSATCPAPPDLRRVPFKAARGSFDLADGQTLVRTLGGICVASG
jgi:hypothetical protein